VWVRVSDPDGPSTARLAFLDVTSLPGRRSAATTFLL